MIETRISEKSQKASIIEQMLSEVGMTKQELIDMFVSVAEEVEFEKQIMQTDVENSSILNLTHAELSQILEGNLTENFEKYLSLNDLKKLEGKISFSLYLKKSEQLGIKLDTAKIANILGIQSQNIQLKHNAKIEVDGKIQNINSQKASNIAAYLQSQISQSQNIQNQRDNPSSQSQSNNQQSPSFLSRVTSAIRSQVQASVSSVMGVANRVDAGANLVRIQAQVRLVESSSRQLKRAQQKAQGLGEIVRTSGRRAGRDDQDKMVTIKIKDKNGFAQEKNISLKELAKEKKISMPEAEAMVKDIEKATNDLEKSIKSLKEKSSNEVKIISVTPDEKGRVIIEAEIKGQRYKIPAEEFSNQVKNPSQAGNSEINIKKEGYEADDSLKIYEQVGSSKKNSFNKDKLDKFSKSENLKFELSKLDAISDMEKLRKSQEKEEVKTGTKNEIGPERLEATKKASDIVDEQKDPSLKYAINSQNNKPELENPKEKVEVKESKKTDDTLKKLDAIHDKQKLMEGLKEIKDSIKSSVHDKMGEALENKDLLKDMQKDKMLNPESFLKR
ncbi:MAG: hypothetical protein SFT90_07195 [Rickettsiales bacterium]|nr:hypothetical protein [Rickettsiales bacterium]